MIWIFVSLLVVALVVWFLRILTGEDERIKVFLRVYRRNQREHPEYSERRLLETVVEWHIPYGSARTWKGDGLTGKQFMDGVFKDEEIVLKELIVHLMGLEYPQLYGWQSQNTDEQMAAWWSGKKTQKQMRVAALEARIEKIAAALSVTLKRKSAQPNVK